MSLKLVQHRQLRTTFKSPPRPLHQSHHPYQKLAQLDLKIKCLLWRTRLWNLECLQALEYECPEKVASAAESQEVASAVNEAYTTESLTALGMSKSMAIKVPSPTVFWNDLSLHILLLYTSRFWSTERGIIGISSGLNSFLILIRWGNKCNWETPRRHNC